MKKSVLAIAVACTCLAIILATAWAGRRAAREADAAWAVLAARDAILNAGLKGAEERIATAEQDRGRLQGLLNAYWNRHASAKKASGPWEFAEILEGNPGLFRLWLGAFRARLAGRFRLFYSDLGLSPAQMEKFADLMTEHEEAGIDLKATVSARGLEASDPAIEALQGDEEARLRAAQIALLGNEGYGQLQQFERLEPAQAIVDRVAFDVASTPAPLVSSQAGQLIRILANAQSRYQGGGTAGSDVTKIDWAVALAQAGSILSEAQFQALNASAQLARLRELATQFDRRQSPAK